MSKNITTIIIFILLIGISYRLAVTANGRFLFNMDNGRDMVDIREMVILKKPRLIAHTTSIQGVFFGPAWYYLSAIPFVVTSGNPYGSIIMLILFWVVGGFFLLQLVKRFGAFAFLSAGMLWVASDYVMLATLYAFNPNPIILLTPLYIYILEKYTKTGKLIYSQALWFLGGLFFNFQINFGIFIPFINILAIFFIDKKLLKSKNLWIGFIFFIVTLMPQIFFDIRHQFIMSKALINFLTADSGFGLNIFSRLQVVSKGFYDTFLPILLNQKILMLIVLTFSIPVLLGFVKNKRKEPLIWISLFYIFVPFLGYLILPVPINPWYLGGEMAASLVLIAYFLKQANKIISLPLSILIIWFGLGNIVNFFINDFGKPNLDPSLLKNEIAAIDYVYQYAKGQNFKVYTFMPSVYDYPYQYLFWWYGQKKYGFAPGEYAYLPNKPSYIPSQDKFQGRKDNFSGLVFLIKEPDSNNTRSDWEGNFANLKRIENQMVGPLEIEIRRE